MKKKILFVMEHLGIGGAEKSLVTLLSLLDYEKVEVDLFLFREEGEFLNFVPKEVNILSDLKSYSLYGKSYIDTLKKLLLKGKVKSCLKYILFILNLTWNYLKNKEYIGWEYIKDTYPNIDKEYDIAIGFLEKRTIYYTVDKVKAKKKMGYVHTDYEKIPHDKKVDYKYFGELYKIITVSEHCREVLISNFKEYEDKFIYIRNFISPQLIKKMAKEEIEDFNNTSAIKIVTVGRLVKAKGIDSAIRVCKNLVKLYPNIRWYVVGEGIERSYLEKLIEQYKIESNFILLGARANPYKYMAIADIYVQPSRYEGYGITVAEAKILGKSIIATDIPEFKEQLHDFKGGVLVSDEKEMLNVMSEIIRNKRYLEEKIIIKNQFNQIEKLYHIMGITNFSKQ